MSTIKSGDQFHKLKVIKQVKNDKNGNIMFKCRCDCGNIKIVSYSKLKSGHTKSCGCLKHKVKDLTGLKIGRLEVIKFAEIKNHHSCWLCQCTCGNTKVIDGSSLQGGNVKSCGCLNDEVRRNTIKERVGIADGTSISLISESRKLNKNNTSGIKGVSFEKKREQWYAQIMFKRKPINLGRYDDLEDAINARKEAEEKYFKEFLRKIEESK